MDEFYFEASIENGIMKTESLIVPPIVGGSEDDIIINGESYSFVNRARWQAGNCNRSAVNEGTQFFPVIKKNGISYILLYQGSNGGRISTNKVKYKYEDSHLKCDVFYPNKGDWRGRWTEVIFSEDTLLNPNPS